VAGAKVANRPTDTPSRCTAGRKKPGSQQCESSYYTQNLAGKHETFEEQIPHREIESTLREGAFMAKPEGDNSVARFTGLAGIYAQCRPSYPNAAVDLIVARCGLESRSLLVDVGCGTGISSRLFARRGIPVLGLEPNAEMRARAEAEPLPPQFPPPVYREGRAEATGLAAATADTVLAAQAFHWFAPEATLREFHRILKPGGWAVLMWNERDEADPFTAAYGAVIRSTPGAARLEMARGQAGEPLLQSPFFEAAERVVLANQQQLDEEGLLGRAFSASYAPREPGLAAQFADELQRLFARSQQNGMVIVRYETSVYLGRRRPVAL
jgi:SAM-dependent methyltransferase